MNVRLQTKRSDTRAREEREQTAVVRRFETSQRGETEFASSAASCSADDDDGQTTFDRYWSHTAVRRDRENVIFIIVVIISFSGNNAYGSLPRSLCNSNGRPPNNGESSISENGNAVLTRTDRNTGLEKKTNILDTFICPQVPIKVPICTCDSPTNHCISSTRPTYPR